MSLLDRLEELAKRATPGPWRVDPRPQDTGVCDIVAIDPSALPGDDPNLVFEDLSNDADAAYAALASPDTILALIAVARASDDLAKWVEAYFNPKRSVKGVAVEYAVAILRHRLSALAALDEKAR